LDFEHASTSSLPLYVSPHVPKTLYYRFGTYVWNPHQFIPRDFSYLGGAHGVTTIMADAVTTMGTIVVSPASSRKRKRDYENDEDGDDITPTAKRTRLSPSATTTTTTTTDGGIASYVFNSQTTEEMYRNRVPLE
jgi:hypothetical protein